METRERDRLERSGRWVVKVGSALVTNDGRGLDRQRIASWVEQIVRLRQAGVEVLLVSSGAVAEGIKRLGWLRRPHALHQLQAAAAVGQMGLVQAYESEFQCYGIHTAQVLLTHDDLSNRKRYLNARSTLKSLLDLGVVPVVNENDTVATDEIRFGDNDTLAALVANLVEADLLAILTDQAGLFDSDPRSNPDARLISRGLAGDPALEAMCSAGAGALGSGGMLTKVRAAARAARSGAATVIASGREEAVLERLRQSEAIGTLLLPSREPVAARKQWLASHLQVAGKVWIDAGAVKVLREAGSSLLPVGVTRVEGNFSRGEMIACIGPDGREVARGLTNYSAQEADAIKGHASSRIEHLLSYVDEPELVHRDNLVITLP
ncbi:glutamate 5-kinase [Alkalilimnicola ehrlichii]|uniref:Glutamate 5-kinase n=1 Tax=Alkalilimnicola ehrlichii TaxID=351052 RepID=A0A3E0X0Z2_9GAMM|nr:glutamate 5-kinase [Alkalilimnicola ehrlichii]RFA30341.1 glutamate 5-kinase [Alkalilimnicola ehrlichii]RFA37915.1 glutamate 5-kinase [Alkalilimnicola ehrlichii]